MLTFSNSQTSGEKERKSKKKKTTGKICTKY